MRLMLFPRLFRRTLPTVFVVHSRKVCNHPREQHCWDCTPAVPFPVEVYRRRQEAEACAQDIVRLWVNKDESRTVEHISHREEKDTVSPSNLCTLNDTWIVRMGDDHMEICVLATGLRNLR
jgi:hypothetical protein